MTLKEPKRILANDTCTWVDAPLRQALEALRGELPSDEEVWAVAASLSLACEAELDSGVRQVTRLPAGDAGRPALDAGRMRAHPIGTRERRAEHAPAANGLRRAALGAMTAFAVAAGAAIVVLPPGPLGGSRPITAENHSTAFPIASRLPASRPAPQSSDPEPARPVRAETSTELVRPMPTKTQSARHMPTKNHPAPQARNDTPKCECAPSTNERAHAESASDAETADHIDLATLNINSIPISGVVLDGRPLGGTPHVGVKVSPGRHTVLFVHPELGRLTQEVIVDAGGTALAAVRFQ